MNRDISGHRLRQLTLPSPTTPHQAVRTASRSDARVRGGREGEKPSHEGGSSPQKGHLHFPRPLQARIGWASLIMQSGTPLLSSTLGRSMSSVTKPGEESPASGTKPRPGHTYPPSKWLTLLSYPPGCSSSVGSHFPKDPD